MNLVSNTIHLPVSQKGNGRSVSSLSGFQYFRSYPVASFFLTCLSHASGLPCSPTSIAIS